MTTKTPLARQTLYDRDYLLWITTTAEQLKQGQFTDVDWENLIEEVESRGRSEKQAIESLLIVLFVHLLKLYYRASERERNLNHWCGEITNFRSLIRRRLTDSPSLKPYLAEIFAGCYQDARRSAARAMGKKIDSLSVEPIATIEQTLDDNWFPIAIDGDRAGEMIP